METNTYSQEKTTISKVVIDAGHGGKDPGTIGKRSQEKNIALQIALKLSEEIRAKCKNVTVICTRTTDEFIELHERAEIANRSKADMFISIHCNANPKHTFQGAETYVMGLHRTEANLEIAKKENAAILMEPDYSTNYNGFDPNSDESYITFTLFQNAFLDQSTKFASLVQDEMKDRVGMNDRGVRQAGFLVLYKTTMPSVLIETGFLSNPDEEKFLMSEKGQEYIASAICRAFCKFKARLEGNSKEMASYNEKRSSVSSSIKKTTQQKDLTPRNTSPQEEPVQDNSNPTEENKDVTINKDTASVKGISVDPQQSKISDNSNVVPVNKPVNKSVNENLPVKEIHKAKSVTSTHPVLKESPAHKKSLATNTTKHDDVNVKSGVNKPVVPIVTKNEPKSTNEVVFRVQIATSPKELSIHSKKFAGLKDVWYYEHNGLFKYTIGKASSPESLSAQVAEAKKSGFTDAFIVAFHGDERITIAEAKKLISK